MLFEVLLILIIVYSLFYLMSYKLMMDSEGASAYECGFDETSKTRIMFSYRFFLIALLFLVFDVEIALMLPIPYISNVTGGIFMFFLFLLLLTLGLLYEYNNGVLNWL